MGKNINLLSYPASWNTPSQENHSVTCNLCPHNCVIRTGQTGLCRVRFNEEGKLKTLTYANACAFNTDPVEKKPLYHFLPGSGIVSVAAAGCNFSCQNCQNSTISQTTPEEVDSFRLSPEDIIANALDNSLPSIAYTYTEPTIYYEYMYDTAKLAAENNLKNVVVTNGYINRAPLEELCTVIDAANVDLKFFSDETYREIAGARLQPVLDTLSILKANNIWIEITTLLIPGYSDTEKNINQMCRWIVNNLSEKVPLHLSRFYPRHKLDNIPPTSIDSMEKARQIALNEGLKFVYLGNVPGDPSENTHCPECNKLLIKRTGYSVSTLWDQPGKCECGEYISGIW